MMPKIGILPLKLKKMSIKLICQVKWLKFRPISVIQQKKIPMHNHINGKYSCIFLGVWRKVA